MVSADFARLVSEYRYSSIHGEKLVLLSKRQADTKFCFGKTMFASLILTLNGYVLIILRSLSAIYDYINR